MSALGQSGLKNSASSKTVRNVSKYLWSVCCRPSTDVQRLSIRNRSQRHLYLSRHGPGSSKPIWHCLLLLECCGGQNSPCLEVSGPASGRGGNGANVGWWDVRSERVNGACCRVGVGLGVGVTVGVA